MIESSSQAVDEIFTMLKDAWEDNSDTALIPIVWGNVAHDFKGQPDVFGNQQPYLHAQCLHSTGRQTSLGPRAKFEKSGTLMCSLRVPEGQGLAAGHDLLGVAADAFHGKSSPNGVWFRDITTVDVGSDRTWYVISMTATFIYDLIR